MKPDVATYLAELGRSLVEEAGQRLPTAFERSAAIRHGLLAQAAAEEFDRAAARRIEENAALRALFAGAAEVVGDGDLAARLRIAAASEETSYRVTQLDASNAGLRALLIELHAHVETVAGEPARVLEATIWRELQRSTDRRRLSLARF